jgi:tRNA G18 (ribose-2'-O)-methylase SpoU
MPDTPDYYRFVVCPNAACRLRFPGVEGVACPLCKTPTQLVADRSHTPALAAAEHHEDLELFLDNVRSVFNVGSIFRSADGCGIGKIYLCGITATPEHASIKKTALGAEKTIAWSQCNNAIELAQELLDAGKVLWALEYTETSCSLAEIEAEVRPKNLVLILGNEVTGVDPGLLELCSKTVHIPMRGHKASLNVATAAGIAAYALCQAGPG